MVKSLILPHSDSFFFSKILEKYRMGTRGRFRFPVMILCKNAGHYLPQEINMNVFFQFHFHDQHLVSSSSAIGIQNTKKFIKHVLGIHAHILKKINDRYTAFFMNLVKGYHSMIPPSIQSDYSGYWNRIFSLNNVLLESFQDEAIYPHISKQFSSINDVQINVRKQEINPSPGTTKRSFSRLVGSRGTHINYIKVNNSRMHGAGSAKKEDTRKRLHKWGTLINNSIIEHNTPAVLSIGNVKMLPVQGNLHRTNPQQTWMRADLEQATIQNISLSQNKGVYKYSLMHRSPMDFLQTRFILNPIDEKIVRNIYMNLGNSSPFNYADHIQNIHLQIRKNTKSSDNRHQNISKLYKQFIKNPEYSLPSLNSSFSNKKTSFMMKNENYVFRKTRKIEQEVDDLKKIVVETKKTLLAKSSSYPPKNAGKTNVDINHIADQVYQNIERRIRIERERKGS